MITQTRIHFLPAEIQKRERFSRGARFFEKIENYVGRPFRF